MTSFQDQSSLLAPLETFDPAAFQGNDQVPQEVCSLVLTLALIYNDCKDVMYAITALSASHPEQPFPRTRVLGAVAGVRFHVLRAIVGVVHELFELIRANREQIEHRSFVSLLQQLRPGARDAWQALAAVALGGTPSDGLGKRLLLLRNKVSFHYDPKPIFIGYSHHFLGLEKIEDRAFVSRGASMQESRFYFADAAAEGYLHSLVGRDQTLEMLNEVASTVGQVNVALFTIVDAFIQRRGFAYRTHAE
jgi:hypothetical protein